MSSNSSSIVISFSIAILLLLTLLLLISYNSKCKMDNIERFENDNYIPHNNNIQHILKQDGRQVNTSESPLDNPNVEAASNPRFGSIQANDPNQGQTSTEGSFLSRDTEQFVGTTTSNDKDIDDTLSCFVKDRLTSSDLLPKNVDNSRWAEINPSGSGMLGDQNFLTAGYHVGINTIGQSLRNANLQLRSEPPNPQVAVSPWGISTIEPDVRAVAFEIGSAPSF
jgi:hypothetical protein